LRANCEGGGDVRQRVDPHLEEGDVLVGWNDANNGEHM